MPAGTVPTPLAAGRAVVRAVSLLGAGIGAVLFLGSSHGASKSVPQPDRSPCDLSLSADGRRAITANGTSNTVSLVDMAAGKVLCEARVGERPFCVALSHDGRRAVATNWLSNTLTVLDVAPSTLRVAATIAVGEEPRGVALSPDGRRAFVALAGEDVVAMVDLASLRVTARVETGGEPWHVGLTPDGRRLVVANARSGDVAVVNLSTLKIDHTVPLHGHNLRHVAVSPDGAWAYVPHISERGRSTTRENIDNGWITASRLSRVHVLHDGPREAIALDPRGAAVGDADGVAISQDGQSIALTAGGTHELLLLRLPLPFVAHGGPDDHIEPDLLADTHRFRRVPLGGRPLGVAFSSDARTVVVANYLADALQVVDLQSARVTRTIPLGGPAEPSVARRGEAIFYDADRCFHHWYSCNTCHVEGHTNGSTFDTFNDGSYETPKKVLSLRGVGRTGPWTWHGWQKSLRDLVHASMTKSMQGDEPAPQDLDALVAFLNTLDFRPSRQRSFGTNPAAVVRGARVFQAKGCPVCHTPPLYTSASVYDVGIEEPADPYKGFNPPSLRGVGTRAPFLHDGRGHTLRETLTEFHRPTRLNGKPDPTPQEMQDLVAFLKSL